MALRLGLYKKGTSMYQISQFNVIKLHDLFRYLFPAFSKVPEEMKEKVSKLLKHYITGEGQGFESPTWTPIKIVLLRRLNERTVALENKRTHNFAEGMAMNRCH